MGTILTAFDYTTPLRSRKLLYFIGRTTALSSLWYLEKSEGFSKCISGIIRVTNADCTFFQRNEKVRLCKKQFFNEANNFLGAINKDICSGSLQNKVRLSQISFSLNDFFTQDGIREILQGDDYKSVNMVFPFIVPFIDNATGCSQNALRTEAQFPFPNFLYSLLLNETKAKNVKNTVRKMKTTLRF